MPGIAVPISGDANDTIGPIAVGKYTGATQKLAIAALLGWSLEETSGDATLKFQLFDGSSSSGYPLCAARTIAEGTYDQFGIPDGGVAVVSGFITIVVTGAYSGVLYCATEPAAPTPN